MINRSQFIKYIIYPTLDYIGLNSPNAAYLLLHTAIVESRLEFLRQVGGPALGVYQIEPTTHKDTWINYLKYRVPLAEKIVELSTSMTAEGDKELIGNLYYATAIARIHYLRVPKPLPEWNDIAGQAEYWKTYYNTNLGKGTMSKFVQEISALYPGGVHKYE